MTYRNEEEQSGPGAAPIILNQSFSIKAARSPVRVQNVGAVTIGSCYVNTIEFVYPWNTTTRVTTIPQGEQFDFVVNYLATNSVGGVLDAWSMCIVFWDDEWDIAGAYFNSGYSTTIQNQISRIAEDNVNSKIIANGAGGTTFPFIMPAHNVVLHFNMFLNDDHAPSVKWPSTSVWQQLR